MAQSCLGYSKSTDTPLELTLLKPRKLTRLQRQNNMHPEALEYIKTQRIGVISVEMPDGAPHGATVHFAHTSEPFRIIILTERGYKKLEPFAKQESVRTSVVIGTAEGEMKTVQMDGAAKLTQDPTLIDEYYKKFTDKNRVN